MNRVRIIALVFGLPFAASFFVVSCTDRAGKDDDSMRRRQVEPAAEVPPEPAYASYGLGIREASLRLITSVRAERPFPKTATAGRASLELGYGEEDADYSFVAYGAVEGTVDSEAVRFDLDAPREARRGSSTYRIDGRSLRLVVESADSASVPPRGWDSDRPIVAGPAAFQDVILVATDEPAFVALDRATLVPVFQRPMEALAYGPLIVLADPRLLAVFHADGSVGFYSLEPIGADEGALPHADPVTALIDPPRSVLAAMEAKTASLMGREAVRFSRIDPYGPRSKLTEEYPSLFRVDVEDAGGPRRLYVDGALSRPYLVAAFSEGGELISSNIDYMGAERVLELRFAPEATYFFAVSFLSDSGLGRDGSVTAESANKGTVARFVIAPKK